MPLRWSGSALEIGGEEGFGDCGSGGNWLGDADGSTGLQTCELSFLPIAIGFFGLGTGYLIWGGQALFELPATSPEVNKTLGMWGFWMPGFMQLGAKAWI